MTLSDIETARLRDLARRIREGEYDSDRTPDMLRVRLATFILDNALPLLIYCLAIGLGLALLLASLLMAFG